MGGDLFARRSWQRPRTRIEPQRSSLGRRPCPLRHCPGGSPPCGCSFPPRAGSVRRPKAASGARLAKARTTGDSRHPGMAVLRTYRQGGRGAARPLGHTDAGPTGPGAVGAPCRRAQYRGLGSETDTCDSSSMHPSVNHRGCFPVQGLPPHRSLVCRRRCCRGLRRTQRHGYTRPSILAPNAKGLPRQCVPPL